ncbi:MAG: hypothetical protein R3A78_08265 [Polyangiales bacterium]
MPASVEARPPSLLGRGRAGVVWRIRDTEGREVARKVFGSAGLSKLVQYVFLGAPNPYVWCEQAVRAAVARRAVFHPLVEFWFGDALRVVRAVRHAWDDDARAFRMDLELVDGSHLPLRSPYYQSEDDELASLRRDVLAPLVEKLRASGAGGLVWQAGYGNPVGLGNFMVEAREDGTHRWVWVDLESGVPALFAANPLVELGYYVPEALRRGRPLFDDVDCDVLRAYVNRERTAILAALGTERLAQLDADIVALDEHQRRWKTLSRVASSVGASLRLGRISPEQAAFYVTRPARWYLREAWGLLRSTPSRLLRAVGIVLRWVAELPIVPLFVESLRALVSHRRRVDLTHRWIRHRIASWRVRRQLTPSQESALEASMTERDESVYLADFGVHLATKPFVKALEFWLLPVLLVRGTVDESTFLLLELTAGSAVRSVYTFGRLIQSLVTRAPPPWIAFWVGLLPVLGNFAFPIQLLYSGRRDDVALFLVHDFAAAVGRYVPIWGGPDTLTEHLANRLVTPLLPKRGTAPSLRPRPSLRPPAA